MNVRWHSEKPLLWIAFTQEKDIGANLKQEFFESLGATILINVYIDGFNLYKGVLENRPGYKWLDLRAFCEDLVRPGALGNVYYFTAPLKRRYIGDKAMERQATYLRALKDSGVIVVRGKFRKDDRFMRLAQNLGHETVEPNLPKYLGVTARAFNLTWHSASPDSPKVEVTKYEEKGSDVNIACYLLRDAFLGEISEAVLISADSDLLTAVDFAREAGVQIRVVLPHDGSRSSAFRDRADKVESLDLTQLPLFQFANPYIKKSNRQIFKPKEWV